MSQPNEHQYCFCVTMDKTFWDFSKNLVLLEDGKYFYEQSYFAKHNKVELFSHKAQHKEYVKYSIEVYHRLLPQVADVLNKFHGCSYSTRYWQLLIGPFFRMYIQKMLQAYVNVNAFKDQYGDVTIVGLHESAYYQAFCTHSFMTLVTNSSAWQQQIYTQVFDFLGLSCTEKKRYDWKHEKELLSRLMPVRLSWFKRSLSKLLKFYVWLRGNRVILLTRLVRESFGKAMQAKLFCRSKGKIVFFLAGVSGGRKVSKPDSTQRNLLERYLGKAKCHDEFDQFVLATLPMNLPTNFLEYYHQEHHSALECFPRKVSAVFNAADIFGGSYIPFDWHSFWCAYLAEIHNTQLIAAQHGGGYGMWDEHFAESIESENADHWLTWGYQPRYPHQCQFFASNITRVLQKYRSCNFQTKEGVLWVTMMPVSGYGYKLETRPFASKAIHQDLEAFCHLLSAHVANQVYLRIRPQAMQGSVKEYIDTTFQRVRLTLPKDRESFYSSLLNSKIVVIDYMSTGMLYALVLNVPTVLFWHKDRYPLTEEAEFHLQQLEKVGVYHAEPGSAASHLDDIIDDPLSWWLREDVQAARRSFCEVYAKVSDFPVRDWLSLFNQVLAGE